MIISVVMTTYNGEKYILEQLESIRCQTRIPDEVIIKDDCSKDKTVSIIENYIKNYKLTNWKLIQNKKNEGWKLNFKNAILTAMGDIICLADQDDIWRTEKIEKIESIFKNFKDIDVLVSSYSILNNDGIRERKKDDDGLKKVMLTSKLIHNSFPGCVYAFRRHFFFEIIPYWNNSLPHDAQLSLLAKCKGSLYWYQKNLITYRRHEDNVTAKGIPDTDDKLNNAKMEYQYVKLLKKFASNNNIYNGRLKRKTEKIEKYCKNRIYLLEHKDKLLVFKMLPYIFNYVKIKTLIGDEILILNEKRKSNC